MQLEGEFTMLLVIHPQQHIMEKIIVQKGAMQWALKKVTLVAN